MWKIIIDSIKLSVRNMELVLVFFIGSISVKYLFSSVRPAGFIYTVVFVLVYLFIITATLKVLCNYEKYGTWNWKDYFAGGYKNIFFTVIWILSIIAILNILNFIFKIASIEYLASLNAPIFWVLVYVTSTLPAAKSAGKSLKEAFEIQGQVFKRNPYNWITIGLFILSIVVITNLVVFTLWMNAVRFNGTNVARILVLFGELARSMSIVVIMSTIVKYLYFFLKINNNTTEKIRENVL